jgi:uncharacterized protein (DUF849 family)
MASHKVIIFCAVAGSIYAMSVHLLVTPAVSRNHPSAPRYPGAAIIHIHARNPIHGRAGSIAGSLRAIPARPQAVAF